MTDEDFKEWLYESGVANDCGHYEMGELHTAITSIDELKKLCKLAYEAGVSSCHY